MNNHFLLVMREVWAVSI